MYHVLKRFSQELDTDVEDNMSLALRMTKTFSHSEQTKYNGDLRKVKAVDRASGTISLLLTDSDLLECPICANPLHGVIIYQCGNGHIACSCCCMKVRRKCPSCSDQITFNRCRAMEKMIESMRFECQNKKYGCKEILNYPKKLKHEKICPNTACYCPIPLCGFANSCKNLYRHFSSDHKSSTILFTYNTTFAFNVDKTQKYVIVQERNEGVIFVLKHRVRVRIGRAFCIDCIGPPSYEKAYTFDLRVKCMDSSLSLESVPEVHAKFDHGTPSKKFLLIPSGTLEKCGKADVKLCIKKVELPIVLVNSQ